MFLGKLYFKLQKFITYSYNIQIIHILMCWNPLENGEKTHNFFGHFDNSKQSQQLILTILGKLPYIKQEVEAHA
jgi:hypothetical protein